MLENQAIDFCILAYNDGSKDDTENTLHKIALLSPENIKAINKENEGHGPTILRGYRDASRQAKWIFQMDSDNEMGPETFPLLWKDRENYDFLLGQRNGRIQALPRKLISLISRCVINFSYGKSVYDVNAPYRLIRSSAFIKLFDKIPSDTFAPNVIISGFVGLKKLRFKEYEVPHRERTTGEVSIKKWKLLKAALRLFKQTIND